MSEVIRYSARQLTLAGKPGDFQVVEASDYDALAQQLAAEKVKTQTLMIELQDKNGVLVDLREQLVASQAEVAKLNEAAAFMDNVSQGIEDGLRAQLTACDRRLEEAVGLLREYVEWFDDGVGRSPQEFALFQRGRTLLSRSEEAKEND